MSSLLGNQIKQLRLSRKMNQQELGDAIGVTKTSVSNYETGQRVPPLNVLRNIADCLSVPASELISCMAKEEEGNSDRNENGGGNNEALYMLFSERPVLHSKVAEIFNRLSDEGRRVAVQRIEELSMIPMYQRSMDNFLRDYIRKRYGLDYELLEKMESHKIYRDGSESGGRRMICEARRIVMQRKVGQGARKVWEFYHYSFNDGCGGDDFRRVISRIEDAYEPGCNLGFVFDDEPSVIRRFYSCYAEQCGSTGQGRTAQGHNAQVSFLEIDKESLDLTDVIEYDPDR